MPLKVNIYTPEGPICQTEATAVFLPGALGEFEVLPMHAPIISTLVKGAVRVVAQDTLSFEISTGVVKVKDDEVTICAEQ